MNDLVEFARHEVRLNKPGKDGKSLRDTLGVIVQRTGKMPEEGINPAPFPDVLYDLWMSSLRLSSERQMGVNGPLAITSPQVLAYSALRGVRFELWELDVLRALDRISLGSGAEESGDDRR